MFLGSHTQKSWALGGAVASGDTPRVKQLLASGECKDVDAGDADGRTPLACAARYGYLETVMALLEAKASFAPVTHSFGSRC